jgi:polyisoprenoid-binding protein YceI
LHVTNDNLKHIKMRTTEVGEQTKWGIDPAHSEIGFKVRHLMIAHVKGEFKTFEASICTAGNNFRTSEVDLTIDASSISTGDAKRDRHLKSRDFFNVRKFRQISFCSGSIVKADGEGNHELWRELTMMGITKNVKLNVQFGGILNDPWGNERAGFSVTGKINRSDWGLTWNTSTESSGLMVGDEVEISCDIELTKIGQKVLEMHLA